MNKTLKEIIPFNNLESDNKIIYTIKIILKYLLVYAISIIGASVLVIGGQILLGFDPSGEGMDFNVSLLFKYYGYIATIIAFIIFVKKFEKMQLEDIGINKNVLTIFKGIILGIIALCVIVGILIVSKQISFEGINNNINWGMFILFIGAWLIQSAMEEIICRGYILNKLNKKLTPFLAIFVSFIIFSVLHFFELFNDGLLLGLVGIINLFLISMIWSFMALKSKSLYSAIGFHFIWNFSLFNIIGLNVSGVESNISLFNFTSNNSFLTGMSYGIEASIITSIILVVILLVTSKSNKANNLKVKMENLRII